MTSKDDSRDPKENGKMRERYEHIITIFVFLLTKTNETVRNNWYRVGDGKNEAHTTTLTSQRKSNHLHK